MASPQAGPQSSAGVERPSAPARFAPLAVVLGLQACLLFPALALLPVWTDEFSTLKTVGLPVPQIVAAVQHDIHPPLYFLLLHGWEKLWLPWSGVAALRAFSAVWALVATLLLDLFWARSLKPLERWLGLSLFALSPCLLLYGRMARSYSMQTALALLTLALLQRWTRKPRSAPLAGAALAAAIGLLYTHYVPGIALLAGFVLVGWRGLGIVRTGAFAAAAALFYSPWLVTLVDAVRQWKGAAGFSSNYALSGNAVVEQVVKIGFGLVSLTIGESFLAPSLLLVPVILLLAAAGARTPPFSRRFLAFLVISAGVGYIGVSHWVSYPFIPARLLWLLPYLGLSAALGISGLGRPALRYGAIALILLSYLSSYARYFRRENFLDPGYAAPLPQIAAMIDREARPGDLILLDRYNTDSAVLSAELSGRTPFILLDPNGVSNARHRIPAAATVWIVRNTHDISPGGITARVESEACDGRARRDTLLEPYAPWLRAAMRVAGFRPVPTHFYQLTSCTVLR